MLSAIWTILKASLLDAAKDKVSEMTKDETKELLDKLGVKVTEVTEEIAEKVAEYKAGLDTETRRTVRKFWIAVAVVAFVVGCGVGTLF